MTARLIALCATLLLAVTAAHAAAPGGVTVSGAWARATPPGAPAGAAYFEATAASGTDRLVGVASPVAKKAMLHRTVTENGNRTMKHVDGVDVGPDSPLAFAPGGYHVMLMGLDQPLKAGDHFPMTLTFEKAGDIQVDVEVRPITAGAD
ncbi:copper chaperone PCu(A)C [Arhodomonas sp. KWT2]|uniref:copper chaperone PCu(A)C n=1 Tax=unclassified Arhodomonas TaxID=2621637 RepID=UPI0013D27591|nr:copper chaperone PCu(A)C [Arhodomonas sp. KWT]